MPKIVLNLETEKEVKEQAQEMAQQLGLPLSSIVNAYLKQFIRARSVFFSIKPQLCQEITELLAQAVQDYKSKRNISGSFKTAKKAIDYLHS